MTTRRVSARDRRRSHDDRTLIVASEGMPLVDAAEPHGRARRHGLPVVDAAGALVGVVSQTDLVHARPTEHLWQRWPGLAVRHLMTRPAITRRSATRPLDEAARLMERLHDPSPRRRRR